VKRTGIGAPRRFSASAGGRPVLVTYVILADYRKSGHGLRYRACRPPIRPAREVISYQGCPDDEHGYRSQVSLGPLGQPGELGAAGVMGATGTAGAFGVGKIPGGTHCSIGAFGGHEFGYVRYPLPQTPACWHAGP
jgi:hypothetical protein